jgi:hypothetical protein
VFDSIGIGVFNVSTVADFYNESAGTSMAASFVSGIASILSRQFYFPPREIKRIIKKSAE